MRLLVTALTFLAFFLPSLTLAAGTADIKAALDASRDAMVALMKSNDATKQDALIAEVKKSSAAVDSAIDTALGDVNTPAITKNAVAECKKLWEASKTTRDSEIIPALQDGDSDKARKIARSVQADRFKKMQELVKE